jgi:hypothetical protein
VDDFYILVALEVLTRPPLDVLGDGDDLRRRIEHPAHHFPQDAVSAGGQPLGGIVDVAANDG